MAQTVFERIPDYFIEKYAGELCAWAQNMQKIGRVKHFVLREGVFADPSPNEELGPVLKRVALRLRPTASEMRWIGGVRKEIATAIAICPDTEEDERMIRDHCQKLQRLGVDSRKPLTELPRAGIPFMPDRYDAGGK